MTQLKSIHELIKKLNNATKQQEIPAVHDFWQDFFLDTQPNFDFKNISEANSHKIYFRISKLW
jgi:hypothetical protein